MNFFTANQVIIDVITDYDYTKTKKSTIFNLRTNNFALTTAHNLFTFTGESIETFEMSGVNNIITIDHLAITELCITRFMITNKLFSMIL